jgi:histidinol-phosphatase
VNHDLQLALELADAADVVTMRHYRQQDLVVERKADRTEVTAADRGAEDAIVSRILQDRPSHAILGEEHGEQGASGATDRWIIDPVDGTSNFVRGVPIWATLIGLQHNGEGVVGVVSAPAMGLRWWAAAGEGAWRSTAPGDHTPVPMQVSKVNDVGDAFLSFSDGHWTDRARRSRVDVLLGRVGRQRAFGDFWMHMLVAEGAIDIALEPIVSLWDLAAVQVIVDAAGGVFSTLDGERRADGGSALSTNGHLHETVLAALHPRGTNH